MGAKESNGSVSKSSSAIFQKVPPGNCRVIVIRNNGENTVHTTVACIDHTSTEASAEACTKEEQEEALAAAIAAG
ncbi:hypothetical protein [Halpernia sp. GG3]